MKKENKSKKILRPKSTRIYKEVIEKIENYVHVHSLIACNYSNWYIGITDNPNRRINEHGNPLKKPMYFECEDVGSVEVAREIELYFINKGFGNPSRKRGQITKRSTHIYVFKGKPTIWDEIDQRL